VSRSGFALFETAIGRCGLAWGPDGLAAVQLPEASVAVTMARLWRRFPGREAAEPPPDAARAIARITAFLAGAPDDLRDLDLDFAGIGDFDRSVYAAARAIPAGTTITYGTLAARLQPARDSVHLPADALAVERIDDRLAGQADVAGLDAAGATREVSPPDFRDEFLVNGFGCVHRPRLPSAQSPVEGARRTLWPTPREGCRKRSVIARSRLACRRCPESRSTVDFS